MSGGKNKQVVKGAFISMLVLFIQMAAAFVKVRVILTTYGHEYYSVFQSSRGIFAYLILIESGFSVAYLLKMYEPYAKKDFRKVQSLYLGLTKMLNKVAAIMMIGVVGITLIYPMILAENDIGRLEVSILIALCGLKFVLPYFFTVAKKQILNVVEKSYLVSIIDSAFNALTDVLIIAIALWTDWSFLAVATVSVLTLIPSIVVYTVIVNRYKKKMNFEEGVKPSFEASHMTKDIMAQKIAYLADNNVDQIILSTRNLFQTAIFTSFASVVSYPVSVINQLISAFRGRMGVQLASDTDGSYKSFRSLLAVNLYIATIVACVFIVQAQSFIALWIGEVYTTENLTVILFALVLFRKCAENTVTITREGRDLYKESKKFALIAAGTNLVLSLVLVRFFEIKGLLIATIIADYFILDFNNYRLVFGRIFHRRIDIWKELIPTVLCIAGSILLRFHTPFRAVDQSGVLSFIICSIAVTAAVVLVVSICYMISSEYMRKAVKFFLPKKIARHFAR